MAASTATYNRKRYRVDWLKPDVYIKSAIASIECATGIRMSTNGADQDLRDALWALREELKLRKRYKLDGGNV